MSEAQCVSKGFDMALPDSFGVADRYEFNGVAIAQQANGNGCGEAEAVRQELEKIK